MTPAQVDSLFRSHGHIVLRRATSILRNRADAEELAQDLFASFLVKEILPAEGTEIVAYLYRATTNRALNLVRDRKTRSRLLDTQGPAVGVAPARADVRAVAIEVLASLPEELASAAVYAFIDEMTHQEIADLLGCSRRHVGDLLERVMERARKEDAT